MNSRKQMAETLRAWAELISQGYEVPAASKIMFEVAQFLEQEELILKDSTAVHLAMLRGDIAKPTLEQIEHIYSGSVIIKEL